jgi:hypothetical protein
MSAPSIPGTAPELVRALDLSARMIARAEAADWTGLEAERAACDQLIRQAPLDASAMPALVKLQRDHDTLLALVQAGRAAVADNLDQHCSSHRAVTAYIATSDIS